MALLALALACGDSADGTATTVEDTRPPPTTATTLTTSTVPPEDIDPFDLLTALGGELSDAAAACAGGEMGACSALAAAAPRGLTVQALGRTCGGRVRADSVADCRSLEVPSSPGAYAIDEADVDAADLCEQGDMMACDTLSSSATAPASLVAYGAACGDRPGGPAAGTCAQAAAGTQPRQAPGDPQSVIDGVLASYLSLLEACRDATDAAGLETCDAIARDDGAPDHYRVWASSCAQRLNLAGEGCVAEFGLGQPGPAPSRPGADALNALSAGCEGADWAKCDDLRAAALIDDPDFGPYAATCGGRVAALPVDAGCAGRFADLASSGPVGFDEAHQGFSEAVLPGLVQCANGVWVFCDLTASFEGAGAVARSYGDTCGSTVEAGGPDCAERFEPPWEPPPPATTSSEAQAEALVAAQQCQANPVACDQLAQDAGTLATYGRACGGRRAPAAEPCPPDVEAATVGAAEVPAELEAFFRANIIACADQEVEACQIVADDLGPGSGTFPALGLLWDWAKSCGRPAFYDPADDCITIVAQAATTTTTTTTTVALATSTPAPATTMATTTTTPTSTSGVAAPATEAPALQPPSGVNAEWRGDRILVRWTASAVLPGGPTPGDYQVGVDDLTDPDESFTRSVGPQTSFEFGDADPGHVYQFTVEAVAGLERVAAPAPSNVVEVPAVGQPDPPTAVEAVAAGRDVEVKWAPPAGQAVSNYRVEARLAGDEKPVRFESVATQTSVTFTDLGPETYVFAVTAFIDDRESPPALSAALTIAPIGRPTQVQVRVTGQTAEVTWQEPDQATNPASEYEVEATHDSGEARVEYFGAPPATFDELDPGGWTFVVTPRTDAGRGTPSDPVREVVAEPPEPDSESLFDRVKGILSNTTVLVTAGTAVLVALAAFRDKLAGLFGRKKPSGAPRKK